MRISDWSSDVCSSDLNAEHVLIADGPVRLRLAVLDGTLLDGTVRFHYHLPQGHEPANLRALRRLMMLRRCGHLSGPRSLSAARASRWAAVQIGRAHV